VIVVCRCLGEGRRHLESENHFGAGVFSDLGLGGLQHDRRAAGRRNVGAVVIVVCRCLGEGGRRWGL